MVKSKNSRHTSAFLLLFLAESPAYGAQLLARMKTELPHCFSDSASVYRSLQELEDQHCVVTKWETPPEAQPRKWYYITERGREILNEFKEDILKRQANFTFFLEKFQSLSPTRDRDERS